MYTDLQIYIYYNMDNIVIRKRRSNRRAFKITTKHRIVIFVCIVLGILLFLLQLINKSVFPAIKSLAEAKVKTLALNAMNDSIQEALMKNPVYEKLLLSADNNEKFNMLSANTITMNNLATECSQKARDQLADISKVGVSIPLGTLTGIPLLSGAGPNLKLDFTPASTVNAEFSSDLTSAGINQTLYRVHLTLTSDIYIVLPGYSHKVTVTAQAAVAEGVIVGDVPQVYTSVDNEDDLLNLVPTELP